MEVQLRNYKDITRLLIGFFIIVVFLAACGGGRSDSPATSSPSDGPLPALNTPDSGGELPTATVSNPSYPGPPTLGAGYPEPPTPLPTRDPYPGGMAVIVHPLGEQCSDDPFYADVDDAVEQLEAEGIKVLGSEEVDLVVCSACGCPTSTHIQLQISPDDLAKAESLGWRRE